MMRFAVVSPRGRQAVAAALAARAVLEGIPLPDGEPPDHTPQSPGFRSVLRPHIPIRYIAHLITITLVLAVVLIFSDTPSGAGVLRIGVGGVVQSQSAAVADPQMQRVIVGVAESSDEVSRLPALRRLDPAFEPAFVEGHLLTEGETLGDLARLYHVSVASIFWANGLQNSEFLVAGQELRIPRVSGIPYVIQPGDTLDSIAGQFQVPSAAITLFKANDIYGPGPLPVGNEIFIPGALLSYPPEVLARYGDEHGIAVMKAITAGVVQESETNLRSGPGRAYPRLELLDAGRQLRPVARHEDWVKVDTGMPEGGWVRADLIGLAGPAFEALPETNDFPPPPPRWVWPTHGAITSPFGWRSRPFRSFHDGLDIANRAGTSIRAARAGRVIEAGWCSGFGYCVKINHGEGITTIYGHLLKRPPVSAGEEVEAGDLIGYMGSTYDARGGGFSTGVHLHFTVKVNGKPVNPLTFLP